MPLLAYREFDFEVKSSKTGGRRGGTSQGCMCGFYPPPLGLFDFFATFATFLRDRSVKKR